MHNTDDDINNIKAENYKIIQQALTASNQNNRRVHRQSHRRTKVAIRQTDMTTIVYKGKRKIDVGNNFTQNFSPSPRSVILGQQSKETDFTL